MSILTKNTVKGIAFDLVTEYLESYSGQKHFTHNSKKEVQKLLHLWLNLLWKKLYLMQIR